MLNLYKNFSFLSDDLTAMENVFWRDWWITSPRVWELGKAKAMRHCSLCLKPGHTRNTCGRHEGRLIRRKDLRVPANHGTPIRSSLSLTASGSKYRAQLVQSLGEPGTPPPGTLASALKESIVKRMMPIIEKARQQQETLATIEEESEVEVSQSRDDNDGSSSDVSGVQRMSSTTDSESSDQEQSVQGGSGGGAVVGRGRGVQRHIQNISTKFGHLSLL